MKKHYIPLFFSIFIEIISSINSHKVYGQLFDNDQNPPSIKWRQINTGDFQLIYHEDMESEAQRLSNTLTKIIERASHTYKKEPRKISIILQSGHLLSNGFVQLAPRRSEFISTPPQQNDFQDWLDGLAIHEMRHVVQFDNMVGYARAPILEQLGLAIFGIVLPPWFYEGDAVLHETLMSHAGRGRLPSWEMTFRTNTLSKLNYSYQKDLFGSFKDITPDYYALGYLMTTKMNRDYGEDMVAGLVAQASRNPIRPYSLSQSLKKQTGYTTGKWHAATRQELDSLWTAQLMLSNAMAYAHLPTSTPRDVGNYLFPQSDGKGNTISLLTSYHSVPTIVITDSTGSSKTITIPGQQSTPHFALGGHLLVWHEFRYDMRYHKRNYQVIMTYDLTKKRHKQLTRKTRLFSPAVNREGTLIAAVEIDDSNASSLILMDAETGREVRRIAAPEGAMLATPAFHYSENKIVALARSKQGTNLITFDLDLGRQLVMLPWQRQEMERPIYTPEGIVFKAHYAGIDNIFLLQEGNPDPLQLTFAPFGAFNPSYDPDRQELLFNDYQPKGHLMVKVKLKEALKGAKTPGQDRFIDYSKPLRLSGAGPLALDSIPRTTFDSKPYRDLSHLFNFHSVSPVGDDFSDVGNINPGLQLMSDNLLNSLTTRMGFEYDPNISRSNYFITTSFQRYYPRINLGYNNRALLSSAMAGNERVPLRWREHRVTLSTSVPFRFNRLNTIYNSAFVLGATFVRRYKYSLNVNDNNQTQFPLLFQYYINRNSRRSIRDLAPKWGQNINLVYRDLSLQKGRSGNYFSARSTFYFPGVANNHSFQVRFNYQHGSGGLSNYNEIPLVSGYDQLSASRVINTLLADYRFPLFYPDWSVGKLAYIKRFRAGFFSDFENFGRNNSYTPRTFGLELRADMNLLRFYLPNFELGARAIYVNEANARPLVFTYGLSYSY